MLIEFERGSDMFHEPPFKVIHGAHVVHPGDDDLHQENIISHRDWRLSYYGAKVRYITYANGEVWRMNPSENATGQDRLVAVIMEKNAIQRNTKINNDSDLVFTKPDYASRPHQGFERGATRITINLDDEERSILFNPQLNLMITNFDPTKEKLYHPADPRSHMGKAVRDEAGDGSHSIALILIDNEKTIGVKFVKIGEKVIRLPPVQDYRRSSGLYYYQRCPFEKKVSVECYAVEQIKSGALPFPIFSSADEAADYDEHRIHEAEMTALRREHEKEKQEYEQERLAEKRKQEKRKLKEDKRRAQDEQERYEQRMRDERERQAITSTDAKTQALLAEMERTQKAALAVFADENRVLKQTLDRDRAEQAREREEQRLALKRKEEDERAAVKRADEEAARRKKVSNDVLNSILKALPAALTLGVAVMQYVKTNR